MDPQEELQELRLENERLRSESRSIASANVRAGIQMAAMHADREAQLKARQAELEEALERAQVAARQKDEFLAKVTHELRTPLNGSIGMLRFLLDSSLTSQQRDYASVAMQSSEELLGQIDMILDVSSIREGRVELAEVAFNAGHVAQSVARTLAAGARRQGLQLVVELDPSLPNSVIGDPRRLRQVLMSLTENAIKFTTEGCVKIRVRFQAQPAAGTTFVVADSGCGMPKEIEQDLFDEFVQGDNSMARSFGGSGLGLAISRGLVEAMGGRISVRSRPGVGSTFRFRISTPLPTEGGERAREIVRGSALPNEHELHEAPSPGAMDKPAERNRSLRGLRILVAEDHPINQRVAQLQLERLGANAYMVEDGLLAVAAWESREFDAILMDCQMPNMDGNEAAAKIRAIEASRPGQRRTPILALTANTAPADQERCFASGMDQVLGKPIDAATLAIAVLDQLGGSVPDPTPPSL